MIYLWRALRPRQWIKNIFIFIPIIFSKNLLNTTLLVKVGLVFFVFCLLSSVVYLVNDIADVKQDREHFRKCQRPLASGFITVPKMLAAGGLLLTVALTLSFCLSKQNGMIGVTYIILMICYSYFLKNIFILDIITIAFGFVLRIWGGAAVINVPVSGWLILLTVLLTSLLALCKRWSELTTLGLGASRHRFVLEKYSQKGLKLSAGLLAVANFTVYSAYTLFAGVGRQLVISIPIVVFGMVRYLYLISGYRGDREPDDLITGDGPVLASVALWGLTILYCLY